MSLTHSNPPFHTWTSLTVAEEIGSTTAFLAAECGCGVIANASVAATPARHRASAPARPATINYMARACRYH